MRRLLLSAACFAAVATVEATASASPAFPDVVKETLSLQAAPPCTTCHTTPSGGLGTANQPLALYLRSRGLVAGNTDSLRTALQALIAEKHDSDRDGTTDADALRAGRDPNGNVDSSVPPPEYGCGARVAPRPATRTYSTILLLFATILLVRGRKARNETE